jgi:hypothetical protein
MTVRMIRCVKRRITNPVLYPSELRGRTRKFKASSDSVQSICRAIVHNFVPSRQRPRVPNFRFHQPRAPKGLLSLRIRYATVSLEHFIAHVSRQRTTGSSLTADFGKARNETVAEIMPAIGYAGFSTGAPFSAIPFARAEPPRLRRNDQVLAVSGHAFPLRN